MEPNNSGNENISVTIECEEGRPGRNDTATSTDDFIAPVENSNDRMERLDVLAKGTPPPTSGDPSAGRNHVAATSATVGGGQDRVNPLDKSTQTLPSTEAPSSNPNHENNSKT